MQSEINSATEAAKDPTTSYNYVKSKIEQEIINPTRDLAMQYAYKNTKSSTIYEYDPIYMERRKEAMEAAKNNVPIYKNSEVTANMVGGATLSEKMQTISSLEARNRDIDIEVGPGSNLSQKQKENLLAEKRANTAKINHQKYLINEASGSSISMDDLEKQDPKIVSIFKDQMQGASPGEIYQRILTTFDNKDDQDYKDFEKIFNSKYGATALEAHLYGTGTYNYDATIGEQLNTSEVVVDKFKSVYKDEIDAKFAEIKTSSVFNYGTIQTGNAQENIAITKALDDFLLGKSISAVAIPTAYDVSAGQKITNPAILDGFVVKDYGWDPNTNTWEMILETKNPDAVNKFKTVHVDGAYLTANLPILRKLSDPTVILASVVQMEAPRGGNVNNPKIYTRDIYIEKSEVDRLTNQTYTREVPGKLTIRSVGDNNPTISFSDDLGAPIFQSANGNPSTMFRAIDDPDVQQIVGTGKIKF
jgi:hypothetical protein